MPIITGMTVSLIMAAELAALAEVARGGTVLYDALSVAGGDATLIRAALSDPTMLNEEELAKCLFRMSAMKAGQWTIEGDRRRLFSDVRFAMAPLLPHRKPSNSSYSTQDFVGKSAFSQRVEGEQCVSDDPSLPKRGQKKRIKKEPKASMEKLGGEPYNFQWFRHRAFQSLKKIDETTWDFSDGLLLYVSGGDENYEKTQNVDNPYHQFVTAPETQYLQSIAPRLVGLLPDEFEYINLGPGTEHKEQFFFDEAMRQKKGFRYTPVDISKKFLDLAVNYAVRQGLSTNPLQVSFEELPARLKKSSIPRFVSLGLTYSCYKPEVVLRILRAIAGEKGIVFIDSQIRDRVDMDQIQKIYDAHWMASVKIRLLGLDPERDVDRWWVDDGVRGWCTLRRTTPELKRRGIVTGTRLLLFYSLRPTRESLNKDISQIFSSYVLLDTDGPFVGVLLST